MIWFIVPPVITGIEIKRIKRKKGKTEAGGWMGGGQDLFRLPFKCKWYLRQVAHFGSNPHLPTYEQNLCTLQVPSSPSSHSEEGDSELNPDSVQFSSVAQSCPTLCDPMNCSTPGLPVHHQLPELTQTHAHRVGDAIQPSHPLSSPPPPAPNPSQHQGLFQ